MRWALKQANLLYREPSRVQDWPEILPGDIYEFTDPPFYEVDPHTRKTKATLQCFRVLDEHLRLDPIARDSWKHI
jgi:hypothetical protein